MQGRNEGILKQLEKEGKPTLKSRRIKGKEKNINNPNQSSVITGCTKLLLLLLLLLCVYNTICGSVFGVVMASFALHFHLSLLLLTFFFLSSSVRSNDDEDKLFQGINDYRQSLHLPAFGRNDKAACLADKIAEDLQDQPCSSTDDFNEAIGSNPKFSNFEKLLKKCDINVNTTMDGIILPVCVPKLEIEYVLSNYTRSDHSRYLNNSNFIGAGVGSMEDWMVVILSSNSSTGSFSSSSSISGVSTLAVVAPFFLSFLLGLFVSF